MRFKLFIAITLFSLFSGIAATAAPIESVNAGTSPHPTQSWAAIDAGWIYSPASTYWLTGVETLFRSAGTPTVTLEIFLGVPSSGGTLLRSSNFIPLSGAYAGGSFVPLAFTAGEKYFIGFRNIAGLGANTTTADQGPQSLGAPYYDFDGTGSYGTHFAFTTGDTDRPILLLNGNAVESGVPETATWALVGVPLMILFVTARLRRLSFARGLTTLSICFALAPLCTHAKTNPLELKWEELTPLVVGNQVEIELRDGTTVSGEAITFRPDSVVINTKKSSGRKLMPQSSMNVPREAILRMKVEHYSGGWGRGIGKTLGVVTGLGLGGYAGAHTGSPGAAVATLLGITAASTIIGHHIGKSSDRKFVSIIVVP
jgi:hypothetical protein